MATISYSLDTLVDEFVVNATTAGDQFDPNIAVLDDGSLFFTFTTEGPNNNDIVFRRFASDGDPIDGSDRQLAFSAVDDQNSQSAVLSNGNVVVAYEDGNHVEFEIRTATGGPVADGVTVPSLQAGNLQFLPDVAALAGGGFVVVYREPFDGQLVNSNVNFVVYNNDGSVRDGPGIAGGNNTTLLAFDGTVTALDNGNFVVTWAEESGPNNSIDIKARIYDANGNTVSAGDLTLNNRIGNQLQPAVCALPGGGFAMVDADQSDGPLGGNELELKFFDAVGNQVGSTRFIQGRDEDLSEPTITVISDNLLLVSYTSNRSDGGNILGQVFDFSGNKVGDEFTIENALGTQDNATVAGVGSGRFVATWNDAVTQAGADTSGSHIGAQVMEVVRTTDSDATSETLVGDDLRDFINGNDGDDVLEGRGNSDALDGGAGTDTASYASSAEAVNVSLTAGGGTGGDAQGDTFVGIENLIGSALGDQLGGNEGGNAVAGGAGNDALKGFGGDDTLDGGSGADQMQGGAGNDVYVVDDAGDVADETVDGSGGTDTVLSSLSFALGAGLENLTLTGDAPINGTGNELANVIVGNAADNLLDGGSGADLMQGGAGDDTYVVDDLGDVVDEGAPGSDGIDSVLAAVNVTLGAGIESLTLTGTAVANGAGNELANSIVGNAAENTLAGALGNDQLAGGAGADQFLFDTKLDAASNVDRVADFAHKQDKILLDRDVFKKLGLGKLDHDDFVKAKKAQDDDDHLIYNKKTGALLYDKDGEGGKAAKLFAVFDDSPNDVSVKDFLIVA